MNKPEDFNLVQHVVCILDFLGQKAKLAEWANLDPNNWMASLPAIKKSAGTMVSFDEQVAGFLSAFEKTLISDARLASLPKEKREAHARFKDCRLGIQQFSDTFVFYAPIVNSSGDLSATPPYRILTACGTAMLSCLAAGVPVRGSICVGWGIELADHNFYGPALAEAHYLEDQVAQYPRVVVSPSAVGFIRHLQQNNAPDDMSGLMRTLANHCAALVYRDCDGQLAVDYLGAGMRELVGDLPTEIVDAVQKAHRFAVAQGEKFRASGNAKLALRYYLLQQYIESRLPIWGIKPDGDTEGKK